MNNCSTDSYANLNYGQIFFMMVGMLPFMLLLPPWIVAKFVWEPMDRERREAKALLKAGMKEYKNREIPYELRFPIKEDHDGTEPTISNIVLEHTPTGYVAMRYNKDEEGFEYWSDKVISYKYLETVARKYANVFQCTDIYIDRFKHLREKIAKLSKEIQDNLEAKEKLEEEGTEDDNLNDEDSVFADLKKYNKNIKTKSEERDKLTRDDYVCDIANKFIKKGKLSDTKSWLKPTKTDDNASSVMSWLSWKKKDDDTNSD